MKKEISTTFILLILSVIYCEPIFSQEKKNDTITTSSGLRYIIQKKGNGKKAKSGKKVLVHYTGMFANSKVFDSSRGQEPLEFKLGKKEVIKGFDEGVQLMSVGDKYRLFIPYQLAYGDKGSEPTIPPKTDLIFDIELLDMK